MKNIPLFLLIPVFAFMSCSQKETSKESAGNESKTTRTSQTEHKETGYKVEVFAQGLFVPWSIVFTDANRILVTERSGNIRVIQDGKLIDQPLKQFEGISTGSEEGLMGLALDPDYKNNKYIYVSYAYNSGSGLLDRVVRFKDNGNSLSDEQVIFDNIPAARNHAGCRLRFGPDGKLYITTGDATDREYAQDLNKLHGKILRINSDGTIPQDNPFPNSPVWSYGHRNPQGIDWYPGTSIMYETEHGPSGFDGPGGGDEVNVIVKGGNYGWALVSHNRTKEGTIAPVLVYTPAEAPASGMFYKSGVIPEFKNNFFFGCLRGEGIIRVEVDSNNPSKVLKDEKLFEDEYGRIRDVAEGPDGAIYFSSSNKDGRGSPQSGDDKIYRIVKK